jgi:DNA mismatch endonuclease (patch repair protein)
MASEIDLLPPLPSPPPPSSAGVRAAMQGNRGANTRPEVALRSALHRLGLRFFKNRRPVRSIRHRADIVFPTRQVAVFVDGCFWHCCPEHGNTPRMNSEYWCAKLDRNRERDERVDALLAAAGWQVIRIWEHEHPESAAERVRAAVEVDRTVEIP